MNNPTSESNENVSLTEPENKSILTKDLVQFLRNFSTALKNGRTGNPSISVALSELSYALQPHSERYLKDVLSDFNGLRVSEAPEKPLFSTRFTGIDLSSLSLEDVETLITTNELPKKDLVILGHTRFGIPKSKLERQSKAAALESVRTAMGNEKTLQIIEEEATRSGLRRST